MADESVYDNKPLSEVYRLVSKKWVEAHAVAQLLEETKSHTLQAMAQEIVRDELVTGAEAERRVKASDRWREQIEAMVEAKTTELRLRCQLEYIRMKATERQSEEASKRAEMRL